MRTHVPIDRFSWFYGLDYKKLIIIVFLLRFISAAMYDIYVSVTDSNTLLPDEPFYSMKGRCIALSLNGYDQGSFTEDLVPRGKKNLGLFQIALGKGVKFFPISRESLDSESALFSYIIGFIYFIFGYFPIGVRLFNIFLSMASVWFFFKIAQRRFGGLTANIFLLAALFLPSQFGYSLTMSRDFLRLFAVSLTLWVIYG